MKKEELNWGDARPRYVPPKTEAVSLDAQVVLCESGNESQNEYDWGDGGFTFLWGDGENSPFGNK